jgi:hypothetical protein
MRWFLWFALALASAGVAANEAKQKPAATADRAAAALRKQLEIALADVCARHPAIERCFLVIARDDSGRPGIWFVPVFDRDVDQRALGEAQQVWTRLVPSGGQIPMMLLPGESWRAQLKGVVSIHVRKPRK